MQKAKDSAVTGVEELLNRPKGLSATERRRCVQYLVDQGASSEEMAARLKVSVRTITRDRAWLREQEVSLVETVDEVQEVLGSLIGLAESLKEKARRGAARAQNGSPAQVAFLKLQWQIANDLLEKLKELGVIAPYTEKGKTDYEEIEPQKGELISGILAGRLPPHAAQDQDLAS